MFGYFRNFILGFRRLFRDLESVNCSTCGQTKVKFTSDAFLMKVQVPDFLCLNRRYIIYALILYLHINTLISWYVGDLRSRNIKRYPNRHLSL